jgi:hypothetical protein
VGWAFKILTPVVKSAPLCRRAFFAQAALTETTPQGGQACMYQPETHPERLCLPSCRMSAYNTKAAPGDLELGPADGMGRTAPMEFGLDEVYVQEKKEDTNFCRRSE